MTKSKAKPTSTSVKSKRPSRKTDQRSRDAIVSETARSASPTDGQFTDEPEPATGKDLPGIGTAVGTSGQQQLITLLLREQGATADQMVSATLWKPHSVRAAMTGLRKKGYVIDSDKLDGVRTYRAVAPQ